MIINNVKNIKIIFAMMLYAFFLTSCSMNSYDVEVEKKGGIVYAKDNAYRVNNKNEILGGSKYQHDDMVSINRDSNRSNNTNNANNNVNNSEYEKNEKIKRIDEMAIDDTSNARGVDDINKDVNNINNENQGCKTPINDKIKDLQKNKIEEGESLDNMQNHKNSKIKNTHDTSDAEDDFNKQVENAVNQKANMPNANATNSTKDIGEKDPSQIVSASSTSSESSIIPITEGFKTPTPLSSQQFIWPVEGNVISRYSKDPSIKNDGINISAPMNTPVLASSDGNVIYSGTSEKYGNLVIIKHKNDYLTAYAHNSSTIVKKGDVVNKGDIIAKVGQSGKVNSPQLYFSIRKGKITINPES